VLRASLPYWCCCADSHALCLALLLLILIQILRADKAIVEAAFKRLVSPLGSSSSSSGTGATGGALYTPAQLLVLLHNFDCAAAAVPMKKITEAVSICLDNKAVYRYAAKPTQYNALRRRCVCTHALLLIRAHEPPRSSVLHFQLSFILEQVFVC
jgi:Symplekin tight junction protein C terminal